MTPPPEVPPVSALQAPGAGAPSAAPKLPLSVCVVTLNEQRRLPRCLDSVPFAGEYVVVDAGSTDGTVAEAEQRGARVLRQPWLGYAAQKQFAVGSAAQDWVLCLDADEWLDPELAGAIVRLFASPPDPLRGHRLNRLSRYLGRFVRHGGWYPDRLLRLYHRGHGRWTGREPHAHVAHDGTVADLPGHLLHEPYADLADHLRRIDRYTTTMAQDLRARGRRAGPLRAVGHAAAATLRTYVLRGGFLEGRVGVVQAAMQATYTFLKYAKVWELQQDARPRDPGS